MADDAQLKILKKGVWAWNDWRQQNPDTPVDLTHADLFGTKLSRAKLSGANLSDANLSETRLSEADLSMAGLVTASRLLLHPCPN